MTARSRRCWSPLGDIAITDDVEIRNEVALDADDDGIADAGGTGVAIDIAVDGGGLSRNFEIEVAAGGSQHDVAIINIDPAGSVFSLENGDAVGDGGAILVSTTSVAFGSTLELTGVDSIGNEASGSGGAVASARCSSAAPAAVLGLQRRWERKLRGRPPRRPLGQQSRLLRA